MDNCLFCKIVAGEIPATKVFEDEFTLAFRDIDPKAPTHILVIPKEHYQDMHDIPAEENQLFGKIMSTVSQVVKSEKLIEKGYRLVVNSGNDGGQAVPHIHVHILGGRSLQWPPG